MNDDRDFSQQLDADPAFDEAMARLRSVEPPPESRIANRAAIAAELVRLESAANERRLPWWRRSVSVPVPVAACLLVLTGLLLPSSFRGWQHALTPQAS